MRTRQSIHAVQCAAVLFGASLLMSASPSAASGMPVVDALLNKTQLTSQIKSVIHFGKQVAGMAKDVAHYKAVYDKYQQELVKLQRMVTGLSMMGDADPKERPRDWNVERCGGGGFSLTSTLRSVLADAKGDIYKQQQEICAWIQVAENDRYNLTIKMISEVKAKTTQALQQAASRRDTNNKNGTVDASDNDLLMVNAQLEAVYQNYSANMEAYDAQIVALKSAQSSLADSALRGQRGPLGTLVKTAALQGALEVGK